jgi:LAO/AO transport system kinase
MAVVSDPSALVDAAASGDRRALARLITLVEEEGDGSAGALRAAFAAAVPAHRIGITGAPGSGKSTLTDRLITHARADGEEIGVLAVDPTSPFSGGAVLGDRVRMQDHVLDERVYVRSMASRGHLGGLSAGAPKALVAMETAGFDRILIETVGVGQDEVEVMSAADTVLVVVTAGWGDGVQAAKAGILEIGDVFVVNKADRPGAGGTRGVGCNRTPSDSSRKLGARPGSPVAASCGVGDGSRLSFPGPGGSGTRRWNWRRSGCGRRRRRP